ncbi:OmpA family protein [Crocinitomicaceae bacterium]|nr:OmpA family protein [Crocinitomicaceae bacterium]
MKNLFFITLTFFLFASCGAAQQKYSVSDKKAVKLFEEGFNQPRAARDPQTGGPDFRGGIVLIKKALNREPNFFEAHGTISEFYENIGQNAPAIYHLEEAIRLNPNISGTGSEYFFLANLLSENSQFEESNKRIDQFMKFQMANPELQSKAMSMQANNLFAIEAMKNPVKFDPVNIGPGINTSNPEYFPTITVDGKTILFTRRIKDDRINGNQHEDFYISCLGEDNKWKTAIPMPSNINTIANEGAPTLAPDGRSLIFVACEEYEGYYGENRNGYGSCDLFYTKRLGNRWTNPQNILGKVNSFHWETQPSLSSDGKTLYFIRGIRGREGTKQGDIYVSKMQADGTWSLAEMLPSTVNTPEAEESVLIHPDGKTLYFGSRGHAGMGGSDLFVSRLDASGNWGKAINLGYPINTKYDENSLMVSADGEIGFFASDREGGYGGLDIYYFPMPDHLKPTKTIYFEGLVFDADTKRPLPGKFKLIDLENGKEVVYSEADSLTGEFVVSLPVNKKYALNVSYPNYSFFSQTFDMKDPDGQEAFHMDVPLIPISSSQPIVLNNVFYDLNKATLRPESYIELEKLREFLATNPLLKIEIGGHTDTRGDAGENMKLSTERAQSVYDCLVTKGLNKTRLSYKGYGETKNVVSDAEIAKLTDAKAIEVAHQKNRRTEYKIIK